PRAGDVLLFPTVRAAEVLGVARWLQSNATPLDGVCLNFMYDDFVPGAGRHRRWMWTALYRLSFARLRRDRGQRPLLLTSGSPALAADMTRLASTVVHAYPLPKAYPAPATPTALAEPPNVVYLGAPWPWKGGDLLPEIARRCFASGRRCRFVVQEPRQIPPTLRPALTAIRATPGVVTVEGSLERRAYFELVRSADVVLLPHDARRYRRRTSGIFAEAVAF